MLLEGGGETGGDAYLYKGGKRSEPEKRVKKELVFPKKEGTSTFRSPSCEGGEKKGKDAGEYVFLREYVGEKNLSSSFSMRGLSPREKGKKPGWICSEETDGGSGKNGKKKSSGNSSRRKKKKEKSLTRGGGARGGEFLLIILEEFQILRSEGRGRSDRHYFETCKGGVEGEKKKELLFTIYMKGKKTPRSLLEERERGGENFCLYH